ncbi:glycosyltransferase family 32 protein [Marinobacter sediminicola]|uniref:glycosyltransferase family 32 protein n=1 Tax=Marinobacter sediminicola TaxID=3072994 RepID=UPI002810C153|nr:TcdA/TcdB catalytic glycosyltransferase domain-containing protein [Marinobacter sp. F26243]
MQQEAKNTSEIIHGIWLGKKMSPLGHACVDDWRKQGFNYRLWTESDTEILQWIEGCRFARECFRRGLYAFVTDYLRLKILQKFGGLYLDLDVTIRRNPFPLFQDLMFAVGYEADSRIGTCAIFAQKNSKILAELISFYEAGIWTSPLYIGPHIFTEILIDSSVCDLEPSKIFPRHYFNPYQGEDIFFECTADAYLVHWYQHSWKRSRKMVFLKAKHLGFWGRFYTWQKYFFQVRLRG